MWHTHCLSSRLLFPWCRSRLVLCSVAASVFGLLAGGFVSRVREVASARKRHVSKAAPQKAHAASGLLKTLLASMLSPRSSLAASLQPASQWSARQEDAVAVSHVSKRVEGDRPIGVLLVYHCCFWQNRASTGHGNLPYCVADKTSPMPQGTVGESCVTICPLKSRNQKSKSIVTLQPTACRLSKRHS